MNLRPAVIFTLATALAIAALTAGGAGASPGPGGKGEAGGSLYVLQSSGGTVNGKELVLHGVRARVTSFTDRPRRLAGSIAVARLASTWGTLFGKVPPNAALSVQGAPRNRDVAAMELRRPRYDARRDTLTYRIRRLGKTGDPALAEFDRRADGSAVTRFGPASLFIDDSGGEQVPVTVFVAAFDAAPVTVTFDGETTYGDGPRVSGIRSVPAGGDRISPAVVDLEGSKITVQPAPDNPAVFVEVHAFVTPVEGKISGEVSISGESSARLILPDGNPTLANGTFSFPAPG